MRALLALLLLAAPRPADELSISFEPADAAVQPLTPDAAVVDLGAVRNAGGRAAIRRSVVRLRIAARSAAVRTARLSAYLDEGAPHTRIFVDGVELSTTPRVIDARAAVGKPSAHVVQIEIGPAAPPGAVRSSITWIASTD